MPTPPFTTRHATTLRGRLTELAATSPDPARDVEEALARAYLHHTGTTPRNTLLGRIRTDTSARAQAADHVVHDLPHTTIDHLGAAYETLAQPADGPVTGVIYTPRTIADHLATTITPERKNNTVLDPSCGSGALLIAALRRIHDLHHGTRPASHIVNTQLHGVDLDPHTIRRAELLLTLVTVTELHDDTPTLTVNLRAGDALLPATWNTTAPATYDVILGNPPYVRYQELPATARATYRAHWTTLNRGNYNLYYAFFELAHQLRTPGGAVAYITPNAYLRAAAARPLRHWMTTHQFPTTILNFAATQVFPGASTYTAITLSDHTTPPPPTLRHVTTTPNELPTLTPNDYATVNRDDLNPNGWHLTDPTWATLTRNTTPTLGDLTTINYGIATLRDRLYLLNDDLTTGTGHPIEPEATTPAVKIPTVPTQDALDRHRGRILFPYTRDPNGHPHIWTPEQLETHPQAHTYLLHVRAELARRDHGRKTYAAWYAYGRTQGLRPTPGRRLLSPLYAHRPRFLIDHTPHRLFLNGVAVTPHPDSPLTVELLAALLNSAVLHYYVEQVSAPLTGGYYSYQKPSLAGFPIPDAVLNNAGTICATPTGAERDRLLAGLYQVALPDRYTRA